jgi:hypothetical protein
MWLNRIRLTVPHESGNGTKLPIRDVCCPVAIRGKPDMVPAVHFGRDWTGSGQRLSMIEINNFSYSRRTDGAIDWDLLK